MTEEVEARVEQLEVDLATEAAARQAVFSDAVARLETVETALGSSGSTAEIAALLADAQAQVAILVAELQATIEASRSAVLTGVGLRKVPQLRAENDVVTGLSPLTLALAGEPAEMPLRVAATALEVYSAEANASFIPFVSRNLTDTDPVFRPYLDEAFLYPEVLTTVNAPVASVASVQLLATATESADLLTTTFTALAGETYLTEIVLDFSGCTLSSSTAFVKGYFEYTLYRQTPAGVLAATPPVAVKTWTDTLFPTSAATQPHLTEARVWSTSTGGPGTSTPIFVIHGGVRRARIVETGLVGETTYSVKARLVLQTGTTATGAWTSQSARYGIIYSSSLQLVKLKK